MDPLLLDATDEYDDQYTTDHNQNYDTFNNDQYYDREDSEPAAEPDYYDDSQFGSRPDATAGDPNGQPAFRPVRIKPAEAAGAYHPELNYDPVPPGSSSQYNVPNIFSESVKEPYRDRQTVRRTDGVGYSRNNNGYAAAKRQDGDENRWYRGDYEDQFLDTHDYYDTVIDAEQHFTKYPQ